jgi:tol-pal system protein YbgF
VTRIERLEEQIVDLQGVVAAVETLARAPEGGASPFQSGGGGLSGDQFRQLAEQLADLTQRIERLEARFGMTDPAGPRSRDFAADPSGAAGGTVQRGDSPSSYSASPLPPASGSSGGFGTSVEPQRESRAAAAPWENSPGSVFNEPPASGRSPAASPAPAPQSPVTTAALSSGAARSLYDQGFGALQRREFRAAETYLTEFMKQYPNDPLAPEAQFYLGEAAFQSAEFRQAADHYLKAFSTFPASEKAPEALLKLAMSLRRLGENNAACDSFAELARRFPQAPSAVTQRAETEKRRANCI